MAVVVPPLTLARNVIVEPEHAVDGLAEAFTTGNEFTVTVTGLLVTEQPLLLRTLTE